MLSLKTLRRLLAATALGLCSGAMAAPRYDHVVIVVMENHRLSQIIGNPAAPYLTSLAAQGASLTNSHGVTHPSQPNYLALFSGSTQGVISDRCPQSFPEVDNLAAQLLAAGLSFTGYSEGLPSVGYAGCKSGNYVRKHNPWVNFTNVPASANQPLSAFPAQFEALPTVAIVVPDLINDMHDGSVKGGDDWLAAKIDPYVTWAKTHNSLLIVTFDEADFFNSTNLVPTVFVGAGIPAGTFAGAVNHYNVLTTIESMYGLPMLTSAAPIDIIFSAYPANAAQPSELQN